MSKFSVSLEKERQLAERMSSLGVREEQLVEKFIKGSGPGGQKINKSSTCVYLLHRPSGIEIKCQKTRSQALNRFHARRELCEQLEEQLQGEKSQRQQEIERIRRQKRRRSKRAKEKILGDKRHVAQKKQLRREPSGEE